MREIDGQKLALILHPKLTMKSYPINEERLCTLWNWNTPLNLEQFILVCFMKITHQVNVFGTKS